MVAFVQEGRGGVNKKRAAQSKIHSLFFVPVWACCQLILFKVPWNFIQALHGIPLILHLEHAYYNIYDFYRMKNTFTVRNSFIWDRFSILLRIFSTVWSKMIIWPHQPLDNQTKVLKITISNFLLFSDGAPLFYWRLLKGHCCSCSWYDHAFPYCLWMFTVECLQSPFDYMQNENISMRDHSQ